MSSADASWLDSMPEVYDRCLGPALFAPYAEYVAARAATLAPRTVLELAAGTGIVTAELVQALPDASITASDLNGAMVAWASERVPGATWRTADAQQLDFADASFDLVVCQFGVMFFPDKAGAFRETARVLAPDGTFLFTTWDSVETSDFPAALVESAAAVLPDDPPLFLARVPHGYSDPDAVRADLEAGGLHAETFDRVVLPGTALSARTVAEGFCLGSPMRFELQQRGDLTELVEAIGAEMTARLGSGPLSRDNSAYVVTARRSG
ncbi:MAG: hypothetical protein QOG80_2452 [Pseudonocardiales bacterium]|nr:hypothetical protein [Pseudonocardiales bacterium]